MCFDPPKQLDLFVNLGQLPIGRVVLREGRLAILKLPGRYELATFVIHRE